MLLIGGFNFGGGIIKSGYLILVSSIVLSIFVGGFNFGGIISIVIILVVFGGFNFGG